MNINEFVVIQAEINIELSLLNVSALFTFNIKCINDCQQVQINKLKNLTLINLDPIVISYDGKIHFYNISLMSKSHLFFFT
jgi:hypothetical protein